MAKRLRLASPHVIQIASIRERHVLGIKIAACERNVLMRENEKLNDMKNELLRFYS